jgi:hypothetical protein
MRYCVKHCSSLFFYLLFFAILPYGHSQTALERRAAIRDSIMSVRQQRIETLEQSVPNLPASQQASQGENGIPEPLVTEPPGTIG